MTKHKSEIRTENFWLSFWNKFSNPTWRHVHVILTWLYVTYCTTNGIGEDTFTYTLTKCEISLQVFCMCKNSWNDRKTKFEQKIWSNLKVKFYFTKHRNLWLGYCFYVFYPLFVFYVYYGIKVPWCKLWLFDYDTYSRSKKNYLTKQEKEG